MTGRHPPGRQPPWSQEAEEALLGAAMLTADARDILAYDLSPEDFYRPWHGHVAAAISDLHAVGIGADPITVRDRLAETVGADADTLARLAHLQTECPSTANAAAYAATIAERAARRRLLSLLGEAAEHTYGLERSPEDIAEWLCATARDSAARPVAADPDPDIDEFLADEPDYRWLVPGLLERGDRLVITGMEGHGKSVLLRQFSVQFAAGIHPWSPDTAYPPVNVLVVDVENSRMQVDRRYRTLMAVVRPAAGQQVPLGAADRPLFDGRRLRVIVRPQGLDLRSRRDRQWFTQRVDANRPDVIITGPLYKLYRGNPIDEEPAAEVAGFLDEVRTRYDTALIIEAHSAKGQAEDRRHRPIAPYGASLWLRWPEFGFGIRPSDTPGVYTWEPWRGPRDDQRRWPRTIRHGRTWPWEAEWGMREVPNRPEPSDEEPF